MSIERYAHIAARMFNVPLAITEDKAGAIVAALADRMGIVSLQTANKRVAFDDDGWTPDPVTRLLDERPKGKLYHVVDGVAKIPVRGTVVHKLGSVDPYSGMVGYDAVRLKLDAALVDPTVKAIWLDVDSNGGEVSGCFTLADAIWNSSKRNGGKRIWAMVNESAYSAAYALASQADRVIVPTTGGVGSIGVILMHVSYEEFLKKEGIKVTFIYSGAHKKDGNAYEDIPEDVTARFQDLIDADRALFARLVARGRGMSIKAVLDTEAQTYHGHDSVASGLANVVASEDEAWAALQRLVKRA